MTGKICRVMAVVALTGLVAAPVRGAPNPAAAYAWLLGYEYRVVETPEGARGVVTPEPGVEYDAWDFYRGKVGSAHQYGALFGFRTECVREPRGDFLVEYAVCVATGGVARAGERLPLAELLARHGQSLSGSPARPAGRGAAGGATARFEDFGLPRHALPASYDWRSVGGHAYIGPVRDQGGCGSCYSFGASAAAEGVYNKAMNLVDGSCADFSESFIIWTLGRQPAYSGHFFGCNGSDYDYAELQALVDMGVCTEAVYPYQESDPGSALHLDAPRVQFDSWSRIGCGDVDAIKAALMTYGVIDAAVDASGFDSYTAGIYNDGNTSCSGSPCYETSTDHIISLVGWDDNPPEGGGGCWILRNSWGGSWGESGYMRIRYTAARVACEACYLVYTSAGQPQLTVTSAYGSPSPAAGVHAYAAGSAVACRMGGSPDTRGATQYVCSGWTGTGDAPASGSTTNTGAFILNQNSAVTWNWQTRVLLQAGVSGSGQVSTTGGWQTVNATVSITGTPTAAGVVFTRWAGDTNGCTVNGNVIAAPMTRARSLTAVFSDGAFLDPPTGVSASRGTQQGRVSLVWQAAPGATHYQVWRGATAASSLAQQIGQAASPAYSDATVSGGRRYTYWIKSANTQTASSFSSPSPGWSRAVMNNFDGLSGSDPAVFNTLDGAWYACTAAGAPVVWAQSWGWSTALPVPGDFDADGLADFAVFDTTTGAWYIMGANGTLLVWAQAWGWPGAVPVSGDYDGDGAADLAVFDSLSGYWYARGVAGTVLVWAQAWGWPGAVPVSGDYDADAVSDFAVFDSNTGGWYVRGATGAILAWGTPWGWPGAVPVPGDYNGDGLADLAVFDSWTGYWYVMTLAGSTLVWAQPWGWPGVVPVPGDYNNDGLSDLAVFDSYSGTWYVLSPDGSILVWALAWGWPGALPVGGRY